MLGFSDHSGSEAETIHQQAIFTVIRAIFVVAHCSLTHRTPKACLDEPEASTDVYGHRAG